MYNFTQLIRNITTLNLITITLRYKPIYKPNKVFQVNLKGFNHRLSRILTKSYTY